MPVAEERSGLWSRTLGALLLARAVNALGAFAMSFLAVTLVDVYGASLALAGLIVGLFGLATIPSRLLGARLTLRLGHRGTIVFGLLGCALGLTVIAASPGIAGAAVGALVLGLAYEIYEPPSQTLLAESVSEDRRSQAFGLFGAALAVASVASGGLAVLLGGVDLRLLFVADAATCVAAALLVALLVREGAPADEAAAAAPGGGPSPWRDVRLLVMLAVGTGIAMAWILSVVALPLTVAARGIDPARTGWLLMVAALVTVAGQRLLRLAPGSPFRLMAVGLVLDAAGFAVIAFAPGLVTLGLGAALVALGQVLLLGPPYAVVAGFARTGTRASYLGAFGICWGIAQTVTPPAATRLLGVGIPVPWLAGAALCLVLASLQPLAARLVRTGTPTPVRE